MNRLRLKLVAILALVALLPALPAAWAAHALLDQVWASLRTPALAEGLEAGLAATRARLDAERRAFESDLAAGAAPGAVTRRLTDGEVDALPSRERNSLRDLEVGGSPERLPVGNGESLVVREGADRWVVRALPDDLVAQAGQLTGGATLLQSLRLREGDVVRSLVFAFLAVYGATLLLVLGGGLLFASRLTRPLSALGAGIESVSTGDLDTQVPVTGAPEIRRLLGGFNEMLAGLREQRAQRRRLEKIEAWRQMARRLAHEIKNPLTPIQLAAQQIRDTYPGDDETYRRLLDDAGGIIEEEVRGLRDLVTEFSQFARLPKPSLSAIPLADVVGDLTVLYQRDQLSVTGSCDRTVWGDRQQIHRVFINLINNALDAQRAGEVEMPVELEVNGSGRMSMPIEVSVRDHGPGVASDNLERVFEPDFTTKSEGMGLGLAIVQAIVDGHGGDISVENHPDGGAVFRTFWRDRAEETT